MTLDYDYIGKELKSHLPFSLISTSFGILIVLPLSFLITLIMLKKISCSIFMFCIPCCLDNFVFPLIF